MKSKAIITNFVGGRNENTPMLLCAFLQKKQTWSYFFREIRRSRQKYTWNFIDSKLGTFTQQTELEGIANIKPLLPISDALFFLLCKC
jgi:hypothetical protein